MQKTVGAVRYVTPIVQLDGLDVFNFAQWAYMYTVERFTKTLFLEIQDAQSGFLVNRN